MSIPNDNNTDPNKPAGDDKQDATGKQPPTAANPPAAAPPAPATKPLTQADIDKAVADALKAKEDELKKAQEREKLSKEERLQVELDEAKRENAMIKAESEVVEALKTAGAKAPKLLFEAKRGALEFKDGKLTNLAEIVADLKLTYADQFGTEKPADSIDAGAGTGQQGKERPETLGGALKKYYKK